jgi:hypothetical protein
MDMGYQAAPATIFFTRQGQPVQWIVDFESKTVTVVVGGIDRGTFPHRRAAIEALGLVEVPAKGAK